VTSPVPEVDVPKGMYGEVPLPKDLPKEVKEEKPHLP
jgi:hypothetical protein